MKQLWRPFLCGSLIAAALPICGCGGGAGGGNQNLPSISVMLDGSRVVVSQDGTPVFVQIFIDSPSETALVSFTGMPGGVQVAYRASDTSPSGTLTFIGSSAAPLGTFTPKVTAMSAGGMASTKFTLVVEAKSGS
ncbi:MAG: hypothetical protein WBE76_09400 [Terracidiphilus sp.]